MGHLRFQAANCKNCYRCIRTCPVKAIEFRDNQAKIMDEACIFCCNCLMECPQNAKTIDSDFQKVARMLRSGLKVKASLAPSFAGYTEDPAGFIRHLYELGFTEVRETAEAAAAVSEEYAREFARKGRLITTACPVVVEYVEKYFPQGISLLAQVDSPMMAHAKWIKRQDPESRVVFIGPCFAKRREMSDQPGFVDAVLTFEEALRLEPIPGISLAAAAMEHEPPQQEQGAGWTSGFTEAGPDHVRARIYPVEGGVLETSFPHEPPQATPRRKAISGIENLRKLLASVEDLPEGYFLELNACEGGCLNGPASGDRLHPLLKQERVLAYRESPAPNPGAGPLPMGDRALIARSFKDRSLPPVRHSDEAIRSVLEKLGKHRREDELNCGACGYSSCRDKAAAVLEGKAELYMCMPYAQTRAESFAHVLLEKTPNAVIAVTDQLYVKEVNEAAERFYQMDARQLVGLPSDFLLDPAEIVLSPGEQVRKKLVFPDLRKTAIVSASYVHSQQIYLVILHDLTEQEKEQEKLRLLKHDTVEMAQKVIENQMRVAQEIAGLLGETTAETKVTLTRMKKLLLED
ncbi:[Fe-Fe] hydrogenase large subunit C-terminal domain-containing protein [Gorillibacterium sp. sgz5001074]|uniref:[Fe-Fe] hydrogenase large subunit C-terminal domain-containing protein n=1 Tax=Gorillibacterium sp. sgz5001074 TaxID=3446695 RepID=UPI003F669635